MSYRIRFILLALLLARSARPQESRFLHQPDVGPESVVFVHGGDLWTAPLSGGAATRLTSQPGKKSFPRFSPDGSRIAFSSESGGNVDIYVASAEGGPPARITYHPSTDHVRGWSPDGRKVLFSSDRSSELFRPMLFTIDAGGGHPEPFAMHKAYWGSFSPDGKSLAYTPMRDAFQTWKRYRGGRTTPIWLVDLSDYSHVEIPHENASDTSPVWMDGAVYFLSDRSGVMSIHRYDERMKEVSEIQSQGATDIDSLSGGHGRLVYSSGGYLYLYDVGKKETRRVEIAVSDEGEIAARARNVSRQIASATLSPDGTRAAIEVRGEILVVPVGGGAPRNLTRSSDAADRNPAWSPDGRSLAFFSDRGGEYGLYTVDASGSAPSTAVLHEPPALGEQPRWSPDGTKISFIDRFESLWYVDVRDRKPMRIEGSVDSGDAYAWSRDGRSIAYSSLRPTRVRDLTLYFVESGTSATLTDGIGDAHRPAFSPDGSTLYFLGSTNAGKVKTGLDLSVLAHVNEVTWSLYAVNLKERRVARLALPAGRYRDLQVAAAGSLFLGEEPSERTFAGKPRVSRFDPAAGALEPFLADVDDFEIAGTQLLYRSDTVRGIVATAGKPESGAGKLDLSGIEIEVDPALEWRQIFREAWRAQRDFFYDENLHGVDWDAIRERYEAYLPELRHRSDLDYVLRHMVGELVNSHISVGSPEDSEGERIPVGLLGADYEVVGDRYRVKRLVEGSFWDGETSPLAAPEVGVREGDYILEVDGQELRSPTSIYSLFAGKAGKPVSIRVGPGPTLEGSRLATVVPIESEGALRRRSWIERNRRKVDELSGGRVAYVYQPNTSEESLIEFDRYFFPQSDRSGIVLDERFNGGGGDPDYQLDILDRQQVHWYRIRNHPPFKSPFSIVAGPKVMLVNAEAGSGGDVYPYQFKIRGLGKTVGTRTWGGVQGGGAGPRLVDGGFARVPNLGTWAPDGEYILENVGFVPDVEVQVFPRDDFEGRDPQLERAVAIALEELRRKPPAAMPSLEGVDRSRK